LTISSTASPVVLTKEIKKIVVKMAKKADKRDKKIMGRLKYIEQWVKYIELLVKEPTNSYLEKYKDLVVSIPLLTHDFTQHAWHQFKNLKDVPPQPKYYDAFAISLFKLLMFFQDNGHLVVPSKEKSLYNWVKNQRNFMRQYEYSLTCNCQDEFKFKPMIINSAYYFLLRDVVGLKSSKWDREEIEECDV
jgi:hypothetical protein